MEVKFEAEKKQYLVQRIYHFMIYMFASETFCKD